MEEEKKEEVRYLEPPEGLPAMVAQILDETITQERYQVGRPRNDSEATAICDRLARSSAIPRAYVGKPGDIYAVMIAGEQFGWNVMQSMMAFCCIRGSVRMWGDAAHAVFLLANQKRMEVFYERPPDIAFEKEEGYCRVKFKGSVECEYDETGDCIQTNQGCCITRRFSRADAERAGLWDMRSSEGKKMPWSMYAGRMMQMRARSWCERDSDPGCFRGYGITEEVIKANQRIAAGAPIPRRKSEKEEGSIQILSQDEVTAKLAGRKVSPKKDTAKKPPAKKPPAKKPPAKKNVTSPWIGVLKKIDRRDIRKRKKDKEEWLYIFHGEDGTEFSTLKKDFVDHAKSLGKGNKVEIYWVDKDLGRDIEHIDPHLENEEREPDDDKPPPENLFDDAPEGQ